MHENDGYWIENIKSVKTWKRGFFLLAFVAVLWFSRILLFLAALAQFVSVLVTSRPIIRLLPFGRSLSAYVQEICMFLTWNREEKPFPFSPWPAPGEGTEYAEGPDYDDTREYSDAPFDPEPADAEPEPLSEIDYAGEERREEEQPEEKTGSGKATKKRTSKKTSRKSAKSGKPDDDPFAEPPRPDA